VGVFQLDASGHFTFVNDTFTKITGIASEAIRGTYWADIIARVEYDRVSEEIDRSIREQKMTRIEFRFIHPDGTPYWLFGQTVPIIAKNGNLDGWVGTITDITGQKLIEDALTESEEKYRALTENTPDILFSTDMAGEITYVSPQVNRYGFLEEEVVGKSLRVFIHPADVDLVESNLARELKEGAQFVSRFRILDKWGTTFWFEEKSSLRLDLSGKPVGIYGIMRDVTERKRVEDAIELANKKLNLMNQITRHDILNTITGLLGCVDMAKATQSAAEREGLLNDIRDLTRVIQRHIAFTKEYQEVGVHMPQWQNANDLIVKVLKNFEKTPIRFTADFRITEIYADPLLEKVFYNLADNAIRYGETITTISIYTVVSEKELSLVFEDDGVGVEPSQKREIFKRGVGKNTGLGLFLTAEILSITGISIEENGMPGKGARFELHVPNGTWRYPRE
jgi:PAS domain S-box-containing protein